ncbi:hypothetical protein HUX87_04810 [Lactobacillus delbrueckii subsp. bulgaricus]|nr:hypothetical protein [Lactobacillus delbrueckii]NVH28742.1 hypothetical protein [Lactobacillus delbrueckii subsp. bulgaricus]NWO31236.1 hypothetical protein [Lactobacillus delbrueckii subsp. bulgaricus]
MYPEDIAGSIAHAKMLAKQTSLGGPTPESVQKQVDEVRGKLKIRINRC